MRKIIQIVSIALITGSWATTTSAQEVNLVSIGSFVNQNLTTIVGGFESYEIECDQKLGECRDNIGNVWSFGSNLDGYYVMLCPPSYSEISYNCVHSMTLSITLARKYTSANLRFQRVRAGVHEIFADGDFLAKGRSFCGMGMVGDNTYNLDALTKGKTHTITVTASITSNPHCGLQYEVIAVYGFAVMATPQSR